MTDNEIQLNRRLSAPARLKPNEDNLSGPRESVGTLDSSAASTPRLGAPTSLQGCKKCAPHHHHAHMTYRHSHRDRSCNEYHHHHRRAHHHKSATPLSSSSSSSASDSAFSQWQNNSESESSKHSTAISLSSSTSTASNNTKKELDRRGDDNESDEEKTSAEKGGHFKIVWQNLCYKVPEKKLTKIVKHITELWNDSDSNNENGNNNSDSGENKSSVALEADRLEAPPVMDINESLDEGEIREDQIKSRLACSKQRRVIFSNLNGRVKSGELTAILGPSGAGKTTFLKCLTSSVVKGVSGSIDIVDTGGDRQPKTSQKRHLKLCIIPQKDYLFDNLTVMENLLFASRIKNAQIDFNHNENVYRVAGLLGLHNCLKIKTSRLSGGQYKRVSIAQELLSQPDILILDEPTSGLDSLTCFRTVSVLKDLVDLSREGVMPPLAIVLTIHQPHIKIFNLFHHVYILSSMGKCVYEGRPEYLLDTVAQRCKLMPPPDDQNPASFIIDLASEVYGTQPIEELVELQQENFEYTSSYKDYDIDRSTRNDDIENFNAQVSLDMSKHSCANGANMGTKVRQQHQASELFISERLRKRNNHSQSFWLHTSLLIRRLWISMWRDSLLTTTRVVFHIIIPFVFYFVYSQKSGSANACPHVERELDIQEMVSDTNIQRLTRQHDELILTFENVSLFFLLLYSFSMCVLAVTALSFPLNMQILLKETSNGWYTMPRFVMAKTLADLPVELTMPMISISIAYAITGQPSSYLCWRMLAVTAVMTLCSLISQTQGLLFGAYFMNNVQAAVFVSQASTLPWIMLSGFTTRVSELPRILQWLSFGSIYRLGIESIVAIRYGFGMCPCNKDIINNTPPRMVGIPEQLRSVMQYYMDSYSSSDTTTTAPSNGTNASISTNSNTIGANLSTISSGGDIFEKIATTLSRANTYGVDIVSCDDVKPVIMSAREVNESTLSKFLIILIGILIALKVLLFFVVKIRTG